MARKMANQTRIKNNNNQKRSRCDLQQSGLLFDCLYKISLRNTHDLNIDMMRLRSMIGIILLL